MVVANLPIGGRGRFASGSGRSFAPCQHHHGRAGSSSGCCLHCAEVGLVGGPGCGSGGRTGLDYFFLRPQGFGIEQSEHWVAFSAFLVTALAAGQLSARANRNRGVAVLRGEEIEKLYRLGDLISHGDNADIIAQRLGGALREILGVEAIAIYDVAADHVCRSGTGAGEITRDQLREIALYGLSFSNTASGISIVPVQESGEPAGSIGIVGVGVAPRLLNAVAEKVGTVLATARVAESLKEAEISHRADNLKSAIYDALAHEARGPLSSISIAATTLLSKRPGNAAEEREMLTIIKEEVDRMNQWIDDAALTSRTDTRRSPCTRLRRMFETWFPEPLEPLRPLCVVAG